MHSSSSRWMILCIFAASVAAMIGYLFIPDPEAEGFYQELIGVQKKTDLNSNHLQQSKKGVVKEILFSEGPQLRKLRLECREAEIIFVEKEGKGEIVERMYDVIGRMQERLYSSHDNTPMQTISCFEADEALYTFRSERLTAEQASFSRYNLPTHLLAAPLTEVEPEMSGFASKVEFSLKDRNLNLTAQDFKGRFE